MISIVIPAWNEEKRIPSTLNKISVFFKDKPHEIIVVSDGSSDNTKQVVEQMDLPNTKVIEYSRNRGKGYAVKTGMLQAKGDLILLSDADLSTPIEQINKFFPYINEFDIIIGSRALDRRLIAKKQPLYRDIMGRIFNKVVRIFTIKGIKDTQCGFKLFKNKPAKEIFSKTTIEGFGFDVESLILANKLNYSIKEVPVVWINDEESTVNPIKQAYKMFFEVLKIRINIIKGVYSSSDK